MTDARSCFERPVSLSSCSMKIFIIPFFFPSNTNPVKLENKMWPNKSHGYRDVSVFETFFLKCFPSTLKSKRLLFTLKSVFKKFCFWISMDGRPRRKNGVVLSSIPGVV